MGTINYTEKDLISIFNKLDDEKKAIAFEFLEKLLAKKEVLNLKKELDERRAEIKKGEFLSHEEIWE